MFGTALPPDVRRWLCPAGSRQIMLGAMPPPSGLSLAILLAENRTRAQPEKNKKVLLRRGIATAHIRRQSRTHLIAQSLITAGFAKVAFADAALRFPVHSSQLTGLLFTRSHFRCRITFSGLTSPQPRSVPCSSSVFNSAGVCICKFSSATVSGPGASAIARLTAAKPCLNRS
jgi:hypothetical protein